MKRPWRWIAILGPVVAIALWLGGGAGAASSALSRDSRGWLAARRYLEADGTGIELRDRALTEIAPDDSGVLVLALPWQTGVTGEELEAVGRFLRQGGTVVAAYSGELGDFREERVLHALGLELAEARPEPPLAPLSWWRYHRESWTLEPTEAWPGGPVLAVPALRGAPAAPRGARVLHRLPDGTPLTFDFALHRGRVVVLPAAAISNAWIGEAGNADFLESLSAWLGDAWSFDEYHHGLVRPGAASGSTSRFAWDLFIVHLALIYLLGFAALARRFGPVWREAPAAAGSTASFLEGLGVLHHELTHHGDAARLLVERARLYDPRLPLDDGAEERARTADGADDLVELAREVSRAQRRRQRREWLKPLATS